MSLKTLEIILWAIPISSLLGIMILGSLEIKKNKRPIIKTWVLEVIPECLSGLLWLVCYIGVLVVCLYLWGEATKQFGILGFVGFMVILNLFTAPRKHSKK